MSMLSQSRRGRRALAILGVLAIAAVVACATPLAHAQQTLVAVGDEYTYFKGTVEPAAEWKDFGFDDGEWLLGATGMGYGDSDDQTLLADMQNSYMSVYLRRIFDVDDVAAISALVLSVDYDDGFVAYINGVEVARAGLTGTPPLFDVAATSHEAGTAEAFPIAGFDTILRVGQNVLAIQAHNTTLDSSDMSIIPELLADPLRCAQNLTCDVDLDERTVTLEWTNLTSYDDILVSRNGEAVDEIDGDLTFWVDEEAPLGDLTYEVVVSERGQACPPLSCTVSVFDPDTVVIAEGDEWLYLKGTGPYPADWYLEDFDDSAWLVGATGIGYGDGDDATVLNDMEDVYLSVLCRKVFEVDDVDEVIDVTLSIVYDDGIVVYLNEEEVGRVNMPAGVVTDQTTATAAGEPTKQSFTIAPDLLNEGENVLAVSVHNAGLGSSDLSFIPSLFITREPGSGGDDDLFRRGDANDDGRVNLSDGVWILDYLFRSMPRPPCLDAGDANDDGAMSLPDAVYILNTLFQSGPEPPAPGRTTCGEDPTDDSLTICEGVSCAAQ